MKTFQLRLIGESDGIVYGIKEYEASNEIHAAEVASGLCGDDNDLWWGGQRLLKELVPAVAAGTNAYFTDRHKVQRSTPSGRARLA